MKISFDPLGNRMSYTAWNTKQTQTSFTFGRFFSPDPFVQAPDFTQNYNRYSYCMNNPVMYTDPDGEFLGIPMFVYPSLKRGSLHMQMTKLEKR